MPAARPDGHKPAIISEPSAGLTQWVYALDKQAARTRDRQRTVRYGLGIRRHPVTRVSSEGHPMTRRSTLLLGLAAGLMAVPVTFAGGSKVTAIPVAATAETTPVPAGGDAADDMAIWLDPVDPTASLIIGTNKKNSGKNGGLYVYDLQGQQVAAATGFKANNVDLRYGFPLGGESIDLVVATNRSSKCLSFFRLDDTGAQPALVHLNDVSLATVVSLPGQETDKAFKDPYGLALWYDQSNDAFHAFVTNKSDGRVRQYELTDGGTAITGTLVRYFDVGKICEGMALDDQRGTLFIAEEDKGLWAYDAHAAAPATPGDRIAVAAGNLYLNDIEGLGIFYGADADHGYLLASEQRVSTFAVIERFDENDNGTPYELLGRFRITDAAIDGVKGTDGIDVLATSLGGLYPAGVFAAQDNSNKGGKQNFKLVPWDSVVQAAAADGLMLETNPGFDPRNLP